MHFSLSRIASTLKRRALLYSNRLLSSSVRDKTLIIADFPYKANTIRKFLMDDPSFIVEDTDGLLLSWPQGRTEYFLASVKRFREQGGDINEYIRGDGAKEFFHLDVKNNFAPSYFLRDGAESKVAVLREKMSEASKLAIATVPDGFGEEIASQILDILKPEIPYKRVVLNEVTEEALRAELEGSFEVPNLNTLLVHAFETRKIMDRLIGFTLSCVTERFVCRSTAVGRDTAYALSLIHARELARWRYPFKNPYYHSVTGLFEKVTDSGGLCFPGSLVKIEGVKVASAADFNNLHIQWNTPDALRVLDEEQASELLARMHSAGSMDFHVSSIHRKVQVIPAPPLYNAATLIRDALPVLEQDNPSFIRKLAILLYDNGLITYPHTQTTFMSITAQDAAREEVRELFGAEFIGPDRASRDDCDVDLTTKHFRHEGIRPAIHKGRFLRPEETGLFNNDLKLYHLIYVRALAAVMGDATVLHRKFIINGTATKDTSSPFPRAAVQFHLLSSAYEALGFQFAYHHFHGKAVSLLIPPIQGNHAVDWNQGDKLRLVQNVSDYRAKFTAADGTEREMAGVLVKEEVNPPPERYTVATLLQELSIMRDTNIIGVLEALEKNQLARWPQYQLIPTYRGLAVGQILDKTFHDISTRKYILETEDALRLVATGEYNRSNVLYHFFFGTPFNDFSGVFNQVMKWYLSLTATHSLRRIRIPEFEDLGYFLLEREGNAYFFFADERSKSPVLLPPDLQSYGHLTRKKLENFVKTVNLKAVETLDHMEARFQKQQQYWRRHPKRR